MGGNQRLEAAARRIVRRELKDDGRVTRGETRRIERALREEGLARPERRAAREVFLAQIDSFTPRAQRRFDKLFGGVEKSGLADPAQMSEHGGASYGKVYGKLYVNGVKAKDIQQGAAGDCYFLAAMSSLARIDPKLIENAVTANKDGSITVNFWRQDSPGSQPYKVPVTVDRDFVKQAGDQLYAHGRNAKELWPAVLEKAYAKFKGSFDAIGKGGSSAEVLFALTGQVAGYRHFDSLNFMQMAGGPNDQQWVTDPNYAYGLNEQSVFEFLSEKMQGNAPIIASSHNTVDPGVVAGHAYSVEGLSTVNGERMVTLRNPWGYQEPGNDGRNDGLFTMRFSDFVRNFQGVFTRA